MGLTNKKLVAVVREPRIYITSTTSSLISSALHERLLSGKEYDVHLNDFTTDEITLENECGNMVAMDKHGFDIYKK